MNILIIVVIDTDGGPGEVFEIVIQFDEENAIISFFEAKLLFKLGRP